ncbi:PTS sugar transporter [Corynebacterium glutamicum ATCC 14067]|nr:PTS sugar transporter [Corynebacterium glutamicum]AST21725.1 PTS sugar transporter [Corynebacterium glutamicum ATCC 14067]OKX84901.1 PTS sugar transporter [Corynebacterium glutamicum]OKX87361.1 PTS sugar transporter [Corynebacterium glutamicum]OKX92321.1 PTS sugar transporter [Corynebacterium glutamicum]
MDIVSSIFAPILGPMAGVGILKGLLAVAAAAHSVDTTSTTYQILYAAGDAFSCSWQSFWRLLRLVNSVPMSLHQSH